jgi:hypothetical protein
MIDPHVLHGGASSWLRIAANEEGRGSPGAPEGAPLRPAACDASAFGALILTFGA